jgi:hypothetical protein
MKLTSCGCCVWLIIISSHAKLLLNPPSFFQIRVIRRKNKRLR